MRKRAFISLAAGLAMVPALAAAQPMPAPGAHAPRPGHSWGQPGHRPAPQPGWGQHPRTGPGMHRPGSGVHHPGKQHRFAHVQRFQRGHVIPQHWWGPQFHVRQWQHYGFAQPAQGHRWIRHYDDAYLIDGGGRVQHGYYGLDWDRYGDDWGYDDRGVPVYVGRGDFHPDQGDYAWVEGYGQQRYAHGYGKGHREEQALDYGAWDYSAYDHSAGYSQQSHYGYGHGPVTVTTTTTTTTTAPTVVKRTYFVEEVAPKRVAAKPRKRVAAKCDCPPLGRK